MTRERFLLRLAERLRACSEAGDWSALAQVDREVAACASRMAAQGAWAPAERAAVARGRLGRAAWPGKGRGRRSRGRRWRNCNARIATRRGAAPWKCSGPGHG